MTISSMNIVFCHQPQFTLRLNPLKTGSLQPYYHYWGFNHTKKTSRTMYKPLRHTWSGKLGEEMYGSVWRWRPQPSFHLAPAGTHLWLCCFWDLWLSSWTVLDPLTTVPPMGWPLRLASGVNNPNLWPRDTLPILTRHILGGMILHGFSTPISFLNHKPQWGSGDSIRPRLFHGRPGLGRWWANHE